MDAALAVHHTTLRAVCRKHAGYESGERGRSVCLDSKWLWPGWAAGRQRCKQD